MRKMGRNAYYRQGEINRSITAVCTYFVRLDREIYN